MEAGGGAPVVGAGGDVALSGPAPGTGLTEGWGPVAGLDYEEASVAATRANAAVNGVEVEARRWDLRVDAVPTAPVVLANLVRPLLLTLADRLSAVPPTLVASGLLAEEADEVAQAFAVRHGLRERDRREAEGWAALLLTC